MSSLSEINEEEDAEEGAVQKSGTTEVTVIVNERDHGVGSGCLLPPSQL